MRIRSFAGIVAASAGALLLAACGTVQGYDAAGDIHAFLIAVRDGDRTTFNAHVDRPALKTQLRARFLEEVARARGAASKSTLGAALAGPLVDVGVDVLVQPEVFRAAAALAGYGAGTSIPPRIVISHELKTLPQGRVCVQLRGGCSFVFKNEDGVWRLIAYEGDIGSLRRDIGGRR